jgi:hypothetical protein
VPPLDLTKGSGAISGVVVDASTGRPVAGAIVSIVGVTGNVVGGGARQLTGTDGQFVFTGLPAADGYSVGATKFGYLDGGYGRRTPDATTRRIALAGGQWFPDARITLWRPGAISGMVVDESGEPVVAAYVRVLPQLLIAGQPQTVAGPVTRTDDRGAYRIAGLLPGRYVISVPSVQWAVPASTSLLTLSGTTAEWVAAAQAAGRDPRLLNNPLLPVTASHALVLGEYPTPPPVAPGTARPRVYPITFYPQATGLATASAIDLAYGEERTNVDIQLRPAETRRVSGRVAGPEETLANLTLRLMPAGMEGLGSGSEAATTLVQPDGAFTFLNVPPGPYTIVAGRSTTEYRYSPPGSSVSSSPLPSHPATFGSSEGASAVYAAPRGTMLWNLTSQGDQLYSGHVRVDVGSADVTDVVVAMRRGVTMTGRVIEDAAQPQSRLGRTFMTILAEAADGNPMLGRPRARGERTDAGWTFTIEGLQSGQYLVRMLTGDSIKSITWRDKDYTYAPFDTSSGEDINGVVITTTDQMAALIGVVRNAQGAPASNAAVIAFPVERDGWTRYGVQPARLRSAPVSSTGAYRVSSLPAGDYLLVAVDDDLADGWKDPEFLAHASRVATRVSAGWGDTKMQELRLQTIKR